MISLTPSLMAQGSDRQRTTGSSSRLSYGRYLTRLDETESTRDSEWPHVWSVTRPRRSAASSNLMRYFHLSCAMTPLEPDKSYIQRQAERQGGRKHDSHRLG